MIIEFVDRTGTLAIVEADNVPDRGDNVSIYIHTHGELGAKERKEFMVVRRRFIYESETSHRCLVEVYRL